MISVKDNNSIWDMSGACLGQHVGHIVNIGQQSAVLVLHASVMPFFYSLPLSLSIGEDLFFQANFQKIFVFHKKSIFPPKTLRLGKLSIIFNGICF